MSQLKENPTKKDVESALIYAQSFEFSRPLKKITTTAQKVFEMNTGKLNERLAGSNGELIKITATIKPVTQKDSVSLSISNGHEKITAIATIKPNDNTLPFQFDKIITYMDKKYTIANLDITDTGSIEINSTNNTIDLLSMKIYIGVDMPENSKDALYPLLLEAWTKKKGVGYETVASQFDSSFYELDKIEINKGNVVNKDSLNDIRASLLANSAIPVGLKEFDNYMNSHDGMVPELGSSKSKPLGEHVNLIVGMVDNTDENKWAFDYWAKQTKHTGQLPSALLFFMNSWGVGQPTSGPSSIGPTGTSPSWVKSGAKANARMPSNIYWISSTALEDGMIVDLTYAYWPKVDNGINNTFKLKQNQ